MWVLSERMFFIGFFTGLAQAVTHDNLDNSVVETPRVECGPEKITISAHTRKAFSGVVYIKNWRRVDGCFATFNNGSKQTEHVSLAIPLSSLGSCGMEMKRSAEMRQVVIQGVWVFSFHPMFETKADKAYSVYCIFKQRDITVTNGFNIGSLVTKDTISGTAAPPDVVLRIVDGTAADKTLPEASTVRVGDPLTFIWYISSSTAADVYGLNVKHCFAETKMGGKVKIIENGCSLDEMALSDISYSSNQKEGHASSMAFKFADNEDVWFKCRVSLCLRNVLNSSDSDQTYGDGQCQPAGKQSCVRRRFRRDFNTFASGDLDESQPADYVTEQKLLVLDYYNQNHSSILSDAKLAQPYQTQKSPKRKRLLVCIRKPIFALISSLIILMYTATFITGTVCAFLYLRRGKSYQEM